ncbi:hypothetical protein T484DRAFT_1829014 [Baffinella frigidus]|nr:hypothetical protein T484DRAFT_1829014 [Cryptophyta sp. CCMP2293]
MEDGGRARSGEGGQSGEGARHGEEGWGEEGREATVVLVSSGDGELQMLSSAAQKALGGVETLDGLSDLLRRIERGEVLQDDELAFGPTPAYSFSKAALNVFTRLLAASHPAARIVAAALNVFTRFLASSHPAARIVAVCPGDVSTGMCSDWESPDLKTAEEAAEGVLWAATDGRGCPSGGFYRDRAAIPL